VIGKQNVDRFYRLVRDAFCHRFSFVGVVWGVAACTVNTR
jgi:hypothetical protein